MFIRPAPRPPRPSVTSQRPPKQVRVDLVVPGRLERPASAFGGRRSIPPELRDIGSRTENRTQLAPLVGRALSPESYTAANGRPGPGEGTTSRASAARSTS